MGLRHRLRGHCPAQTPATSPAKVRRRRQGTEFAASSATGGAIPRARFEHSQVRGVLDRTYEAAAGRGVIYSLNIAKKAAAFGAYLECGCPSRWPLPCQQCASRTVCMPARPNAVLDYSTFICRPKKIQQQKKSLGGHR